MRRSRLADTHVLMTSSRAFASSWFVGVAIVGGCGGNVVVDSGAGGGSTGTTPGAPTCDAVCPKLQEACPGQTDSCTLMCGTFDDFAAQGACLIETASYFSCLDAPPEFACGGGEGTCATVAEDLATCFVAFCGLVPNGC